MTIPLLLPPVTFTALTGRPIADQHAFAPAIVGTGAATRIDVTAAIDLGLITCPTGPARLHAAASAFADLDARLIGVVRTLATGPAQPLEQCGRVVAAAGGVLVWRRRWSAVRRGTKSSAEGPGGRLRGPANDLMPLPVGPSLRELAGAAFDGRLQPPLTVALDEAAVLAVKALRPIRGGTSVDAVLTARLWQPVYPIAGAVSRGSAGWRHLTATLRLRRRGAETAATAPWWRVVVRDLMVSPTPARPIQDPAARDDVIAMLDTGTPRWALQPLLAGDVTNRRLRQQEEGAAHRGRPPTAGTTCDPGHMTAS